jgi:hypothetical protein
MALFPMVGFISCVNRNKLKFCFFVSKARQLISQGLDEIKCFNLNFFTQYKCVKWINSLTTMGKYLSKSYLIRHSRHISSIYGTLGFLLHVCALGEIGNLARSHTNTLKSKREMTL